MPKRSYGEPKPRSCLLAGLWVLLVPALGAAADVVASAAVVPRGQVVTTEARGWTNMPGMATDVTAPAGMRLEIIAAARAWATDGGTIRLRALVDGKGTAPESAVFAGQSSSRPQTFVFSTKLATDGNHEVRLQWYVEKSGVGRVGARTLAVRAVPEVDREVSSAVASTARFNATGETEFVPVPEMTTWIATAAGQDLAIAFSADASVAFAPRKRMIVRALVDGIPAEPPFIAFAVGEAEAGSRTFVFSQRNVTLGSHRVDIQWTVDPGGTGWLGPRTLAVTSGRPTMPRGALAIKTTAGGPFAPPDGGQFAPLPGGSIDVVTPANGNLAITLSAEAWARPDRPLWIRALVDGQPANPPEARLAADLDVDDFAARSVTFTKAGLAAGRHRVRLDARVLPGGSAAAGVGKRTLLVTSARDASVRRTVQSRWNPRPDLDTHVTPAIAAFDGELHLVAVAPSGAVGHTSTDCPGCWSPAREVGSSPDAFRAHAGTAPAVLAVGGRLHLFVRGENDDLWKAELTPGGGWIAWQRVTTHRRVVGRFSMTMTRSLSGRWDTYVLHAAPGPAIELSHVIGRGRSSAPVHRWPGALRGTLTSDGVGRLAAAVQRDEGSLALYVTTPPGTSSRPWSEVWAQPLAVDRARGGQGRFADLSEIVRYGGAYHLAVSETVPRKGGSSTYEFVVRHRRLTVSGADDGFSREISPRLPVSGAPPRSALAVYRHKLVAAYTDGDGRVRYSRLDNADRSLPWVDVGRSPRFPATATRVGERSTRGRPALAAYNRPTARSIDPGGRNYGNDLFAAISSRASGAAEVINFSRAVFLLELETEFAFFDARSENFKPGVCRDQTSENSPLPLRSAAEDGRAIFSEIGAALWSLPAWWIRDDFKTTATLACDERNSSGRFNPPCGSARYPIVLMDGGIDFSCSAAWIFHGGKYDGNLLHELLHTVQTNLLGFVSGGPVAGRHDRTSGLSLAALKKGYQVFGEELNGACLDNKRDDGCPDNTRITGFVDLGDNNYNASTRQHSFIGALTAYLSRGDRMRTWIGEDRAAGSNLLGRKYAWIRDNIYRGVELADGGAPR